MLKTRYFVLCWLNKLFTLHWLERLEWLLEYWTIPMSTFPLKELLFNERKSIHSVWNIELCLITLEFLIFWSNSMGELFFPFDGEGGFSPENSCICFTRQRHIIKYNLFQITLFSHVETFCVGSCDSVCFLHFVPEQRSSWMANSTSSAWPWIGYFLCRLASKKRCWAWGFKSLVCSVLWEL